MSVSRLAQMGNHYLPPALHLSTDRHSPSLLLGNSQSFPGHLQKREGGSIFQSELVGGSVHQGRKAEETQPCWGEMEEDGVSPGLKRLRALH